jgi:hypothetical protein
MKRDVAIVVRLNELERRRWNKAAAEAGLTVADIVRTSVRHYLEFLAQQAAE